MNAVVGCWHSSVSEDNGDQTNMCLDNYVYDKCINVGLCVKMNYWGQAL